MSRSLNFFFVSHFLNDIFYTFYLLHGYYITRELILVHKRNTGVLISLNPN